MCVMWDCVSLGLSPPDRAASYSLGTDCLSYMGKSNTAQKSNLLKVF